MQFAPVPAASVADPAATDGSLACSSLDHGARSPVSGRLTFRGLEGVCGRGTPTAEFGCDDDAPREIVLACTADGAYFGLDCCRRGGRLTARGGDGPVAKGTHADRNPRQETQDGQTGG